MDFILQTEEFLVVHPAEDSQKILDGGSKSYLRTMTKDLSRHCMFLITNCDIDLQSEQYPMLLKGIQPSFLR